MFQQVRCHLRHMRANYSGTPGNRRWSLADGRLGGASFAAENTCRHIATRSSSLRLNREGHLRLRVARFDVTALKRSGIDHRSPWQYHL